jgi:WD40 repeat protein
MPRFAAILLVFSITSLALAQKPKQPIGAIPAEPLAIKLGEPLSTRALVQRPPAIKGLVSWSLESRRHRGNFSCMALSPDGKHLATGGIDGTVRVWDVETGKLARALIGHQYYVYGLCWSPDGNTLASAGSFDATIRLWDTRSGHPLRVIKGLPSYVVQVTWSPDGKSLLAAGGESGIVTRWDAATSKEMGKVELGRPVLSISWNPDGRSAAIVAQTLAVQILDIESNKLVRSVGDIKTGFLSCAWSPDGKTLAAGAPTSTLLFDAEGSLIRTLAIQGAAVTWSPDSKHVATASPAGTRNTVWEVATGTPTKTIPGTSYLLAYLPDGQNLIGGDFTSFNVFDIAAGKATRNFEIAGTMPPLWWSGKPLVSGVGTERLSLWDPNTGKLLRTLEGRHGAVAAVAWSSDGKTLATASHDKTVNLWEYATGKLLQTFSTHKAAVLAVAFSSDGKTIASAGADKLVLIWDSTTGELKHTLKGHTAEVTALAWAPGQSGSIASGSNDKTVRTWNSKTGAAGKEFTETGESAILALTWSPDAKILASGHYDHRVRLWQVSSGNLIYALEEAGSPPQVTSLAWSPSDLLASGRGNHTLQIWNAKTGAKVIGFPAMAPVQRVAWVPGGAVVVCCDSDRTTRFFDIGSGQLRGVLLAEDGQIITVGAEGHYRADKPDAELIYVAQAEKAQETHTPASFAAKYKWRNNPTTIKLTAK